MYTSPEGRHLSERQAMDLDDTYLASNPFQYFTSRIASLLDWYDSAVSATQPSQFDANSLRSQFSSHLRRQGEAAAFKKSDVEGQVAMDALSVRQHAAEALVRFAAVRLAPEASSTVPCLWAEVAMGPNQISDVIDRLRERTKDPHAGEAMFRALVAPGNRASSRSDTQIIDACNLMVEWIVYAVSLLSSSEIDLQAGHNKIKHGLAIRSRSDMRLGLVLAPLPEGDAIPLSALTGPDAVEILNRPVLEFLARPSVDGHRQGLEVTQLRLEPSALLADAYMLALAHGSLFHVAACEHFAERDDLNEGLVPPAHPGYLIGGPRPHDIDAKSALGMRFPLTEPPGGGGVKRGAGVGFRDYFIPLRIDYAGHRRTRVVEG